MFAFGFSQPMDFKIVIFHFINVILIHFISIDLLHTSTVKLNYTLKW